MLEFILNLPLLPIKLLQNTPSNIISFIFSAVLIAIFLTATVFIIIRYFRFSGKYKSLAQLLIDETSSSIYFNRLDINNRASKSQSSHISDLWKEFDESLVTDSVNEKLFNTIDAEHFFNKETLAPKITSNRLLVATPSFLVAIGVLGTFVGLTVGLSSLEGMANNVGDSGIEELKIGIFGLIDGASIAFLTSVWGVLLSIALNYFEKQADSLIRVKITLIQNRIDFLYPRLVAEQSLLNIANSTNESKQALLELHERIGDRLQETIAQMSTSMEQAIIDALNKVVGPAMETLVSQTGHQSNQVMQNLMDSYLEGMKEAGGQQASQMSEAAEKIDSVITNIGSKFDTVLDSIQEQQAEQRTLTETSSNNLQEYSQYHKEVTESMKSVADALTQSSTKLDNSSSQLGILSVNLKDIAESLGNKIASITEKLEESTSLNINIVNSQKEQIGSLTELQQNLLSASSSLEEAALKASNGFVELKSTQQDFLQNVKTEFNLLGESLSEQVLKVEQQASQWLQSYHQEVGNQVNERMNEWNTLSLQYAEQMHRNIQEISSLLDELEARK